MSAHRALAAALIAGLICANDAGAQTAGAIVESEGEAKVEVAPDAMSFAFTKTFAGPTLIDTAAQASAFEKALAQALSDLNSAPARQDPARLAMAPGGQEPASARIVVSFPIPAPGPAADGPAAVSPLVELAEKVRKAGLSLQARPAFAGFDVNDRETPEQEAIARASENALYHAEAVGALLEGRVIGVEHISIVETRWDGLEAGEGALAIPPAIQCVARVRISYRYSSAVR